VHFYMNISEKKYHNSFVGDRYAEVRARWMCLAATDTPESNKPVISIMPIYNRLHIRCSNSLILLLCSHHQCMKPVIRSSCLAHHHHLLTIFHSSHHNLLSLSAAQWNIAHLSLGCIQCLIILSVRLQSGLHPLPVVLLDPVHQVPIVRTACVRHLEHLSI